MRDEVVEAQAPDESPRVGDPLDKNTDVGASTRPVAETINRFLDEGKAGGSAFWQAEGETPRMATGSSPAFSITSSRAR